jgi:hypothetical protein
MSMKSSNNTNRNQTHDLPDCSAVPQPTANPVVGFCKQEINARFQVLKAVLVKIQALISHNSCNLPMDPTHLLFPMT